MDDAIVWEERSARAGEVSSVETHPHDPLDAEGVLALLTYEESHGKRPAVVRALTERLLAVRRGEELSRPLGEDLPRSLAG